MRSLYDAVPCSLPYIRLVELLPGYGPLVCRLKKVVPKDYEYETLSYCWSDPALEDPFITLNDEAFPIRENLVEALTRLRHPETSRFLWIDAICINQDDIAEKSEQVSRMRDIYATGTHNNIWLGRHDDSTARTFGYIRALASETKTCPGEAIYGLSALTPDLLFGANPVLYALISLFNKQWFHRGWIVQEVTVAKASTVYCGDYTLPWADLSSVKDRLAPLAMAYDTLNSQRDAYIHETDDLASVIARNISYQFTDPRDRIYAMLGLVKNAVKRYGVVADYSVDADDVLLEATYRCIEGRGNLDILSVVAGRTESDKARPSWVLASEYSWSDNAMPFHSFAWNGQLLRAQRRPTFSCSGTSELSCGLGVSNGSLRLMGFDFAQVDRVSIAYSPGKCSARFGLFIDILRGMRPWLVWRALADIDSCNVYHRTGESIRSVFWQVVSGGVLYEDISVTLDSCDQFEETYGAMLLIPPLLWCCQPLLAIVLVYCFLRAWVLISIGKRTMSSVLYNPCPTISNRKLFVASNGAMGMGPKKMRVGDVVFILQGVKVPLILRQTKSSNTWQLIGESYVHGIMHGEAYRDDLCEPVTLT